MQKIKIKESAIFNNLCWYCSKVGKVFNVHKIDINLKLYHCIYNGSKDWLVLFEDAEIVE